ncbi:SSL2 DNA or RNA helicases of superfamily II [uncultured Caudovirales phage]|uniref:SSL2 DNA or RNA helicases of superfamily II n=1 Tax=uncultured Caudovirales phage TaxID=2100421 RepID=A0A6J5N636_9CAUD|nr:SSL2 DNA or RNA helicases of superfamily II [uncultured Caudovirales phage]
MIALRPYQTEAIHALYAYFGEHAGNPLIVLPTGAGKSLTLAAFIKGAIEQYSTTRIMVLTHVKELIEQDAKAIIRYWPQAPIGIWSAGVGQKQKAQVTVAGIQSVHEMPAKFGGTDLVIVDEAHLVPRKANTMYGRFLAGLKHYNPHLKVIGLTATAYRMDSGLLTEGEDRVFTDVAYEAHVGDLIKLGYLCPLVAKNGATKADLSSVHTRGGEFVANELQAAMDKEGLIQGALHEVNYYAADRKHILGFCAGVEHAEHCAAAARARGWTADYVSGEMDNTTRDRVIGDFKAGRIRFLFNAMLLTTGFDFPSIDCIVMLRPTKSVGLYVQIMGRGLRMDGVKENTLVLDFAGNVERHGPIDQIRVKSKRAKDEDAVSVAPVKECPDCHELVHTSVMLCPGCGHIWEAKASHGTTAADAVIVAALEKPKQYAVLDVQYREHRKFGKPPSIRVTYECGASFFDEWLPLEDERAFVRKHAVAWCWKRGIKCPDTVAEFMAMVEAKRVPAPVSITVKPDGKFWRVIDAKFDWSKEGVA